MSSVKREYLRDVASVSSVKGAVIFKVNDDAGEYFQAVLWRPYNDVFMSRQVAGMDIDFNIALSKSIRTGPAFITWSLNQPPELSYVFGRIVRGKCFVLSLAVAS